MNRVLNAFTAVEPREFEPPPGEPTAEMVHSILSRAGSTGSLDDGSEVVDLLSPAANMRKPLTESYAVVDAAVGRSACAANVAAVLATDGQRSPLGGEETADSEEDPNTLATDEDGVPLIFKHILAREVFLVHALHKYVYMYIPRAHVHVRSEKACCATA